MKSERSSTAYLMFILLIAFALLEAGCASKNKSVGLGAALGASTGVLLGGIADPGRKGELRTRNVVVGATFGTITGMATGSILHEQSAKQKEAAFKKGQTTAPSSVGTMPTLKNANVERHWVESRVEGNRFVEGHFEYIIVEPSRWESL